jgi:drug/metabolite transporter (DMT)-like permease
MRPREAAAPDVAADAPTGRPTSLQFRRARTPTVTAALALLSSLLWGTSDFLGGTASRRLPVTTVVLSSQAWALVLLVPLALLAGPGRLGDVAPPAVAAGLVGPAALLAFYRALAVGTMGVVAPVAALGVVVPVAAGLVAGEAPSAVQLVGIAVAVVGVVLASGPELRGGEPGGAQSLVLALGSAAGFGAVFVLLARGAERGGGGVGAVVLVLVAMRLTSVTALVLLRALRRSGPRAPRSALRGALPVLAVVGLFDVGANGAFAVASQSGLVSVTSVLASLYPVVTGVLAWRLAAERLEPPQWWGVGLAMTGVVLLAAG